MLKFSQKDLTDRGLHILFGTGYIRFTRAEQNQRWDPGSRSTLGLSVRNKFPTRTGTQLVLLYRAKKNVTFGGYVRFKEV